MTASARSARPAGRARPSGRRGQWLIPAGLLLLSLIPIVASAARINSLATGTEFTGDDDRFFASPAPVLVHVTGAIVYTIAGAFQFHPGFRRRRRGWHRAAGRVLVPAGLAVALSAVWMALFYPRNEVGSDLLDAFRISFGAAMAAFIVLGFTAIRRRDIERHRAWMMRAYALALGAGTQAVLFLLWAAALRMPLGETDVLSTALLHAAAWLLNLAVAEWLIRRQPRKRPRSSTGLAPTPAGQPSGG